MGGTIDKTLLVRRPIKYKTVGHAFIKLIYEIEVGSKFGLRGESLQKYVNYLSDMVSWVLGVWSIPY